MTTQKLMHSKEISSRMRKIIASYLPDKELYPQFISNSKEKTQQKQKHTI